MIDNGAEKIKKVVRQEKILFLNLNQFMYNQDNCGYGYCYSGPMEWSRENRIAMLEKKEKMLEAKLEFIRKIKENAIKEQSKDKKA